MSKKKTTEEQLEEIEEEHSLEHTRILEVLLDIRDLLKHGD